MSSNPSLAKKEKSTCKSKCSVVAQRAQTAKRARWAKKRAVCGAGVGLTQAKAKRKAANAKRAFRVQIRVGKKEKSTCKASALWLPNEDLNPDKQSQSLSCCRYTIGQYLTCFIIIAILFIIVNRSFNFF